MLKRRRSALPLHLTFHWLSSWMLLVAFSVPCFHRVFLHISFLFLILIFSDFLVSYREFLFLVCGVIFSSPISFSLGFPSWRYQADQLAFLHTSQKLKKCGRLKGLTTSFLTIIRFRGIPEDLLLSWRPRMYIYLSIYIDRDNTCIRVPLSPLPNRSSKDKRVCSSSSGLLLPFLSLSLYSCVYILLLFSSLVQLEEESSLPLTCRLVSLPSLANIQDELKASSVFTRLSDFFSPPLFLLRPKMKKRKPTTTSSSSPSCRSSPSSSVPVSSLFEEGYLQRMDMTIFGTAAAVEMREEQRRAEKRKEANSSLPAGVQVDARQLVSCRSIDVELINTSRLSLFAGASLLFCSSTVLQKTHSSVLLSFSDVHSFSFYLCTHLRYVYLLACLSFPSASDVSTYLQAVYTSVDFCLSSVVLSISLAQIDVSLIYLSIHPSIYLSIS